METDPTGRAETPAPGQQSYVRFSDLKHDTVQVWIGVDFGYSDAEIHEALGLPLPFIADVRRNYLRYIGCGECV